MTEETAIKAKKLYELKSEISKDISELINSQVKNIGHLSKEENRMMYNFGFPSINIEKYGFADEIKTLTLERLQQKLTETEELIKNL